MAAKRGRMALRTKYTKSSNEVVDLSAPDPLWEVAAPAAPEAEPPLAFMLLLLLLSSGIKFKMSSG